MREEARDELRRVAASGSEAYARQYRRVSSTTTGMISRRPAHMSRIMTPFDERAERIERPERPSEPEGRADVAERRRGRANGLEGRDVEPGARRLDRQHQRTCHEEADVDEREREDCA